MRRRDLPDDDPTLRPPSGARMREVRARGAMDATDATDDATEVPLMSELRTKRGSSDPLDTPAAAEALRPARLPRDAEELLGVPPEPGPEPEAAPARREERRPAPPPASPAARAVLLVLGGVLAMWVLAMVVLAVLHYAR